MIAAESSWGKSMIGYSVLKSAYDSGMDCFIVDTENATNYDVLRITKGKGKTTVYAWVYYAEYSFDGTDVKMESASHIPTAVTFDTSADDSDSSTYDVIEYWIPRDGSYYAKDIREKFPMLLWGKAFDVSGASLQKEKCLQKELQHHHCSKG